MKISCFWQTRLLLPAVVVLALSGCGGSAPPPQTFAPLDYAYLPPIRLKIASLAINDDYAPSPAAAELIAQDPEPPAEILKRMLQLRLVPDGTPGTGTATIETASVEQVGASYLGTMTVRLDVANSANTRTGFTEATVSVSDTAPPPDAGADAVKAALYGITKHMMDAMNVQLQYQIQHDMGYWVSYRLNAAPAPIGRGADGIVATPLTTPGVFPPTASPSPATPTGSSSGGSLDDSYPPPQSNGLPLGSGTLGKLPAGI
jgi:hypothetical protein